MGVGASSSAEGAEVEAKLETDEAHIGGTAIVDGTINTRLEDGRISGGDSIGLHCTGGVVKRDHRKASHVQPMVMEVLIKIVLQTGNGGSGIKVHPQMIDVDIRRQVERLQICSSDVEGMRKLGDMHERVNIGV